VNLARYGSYQIVMITASGRLPRLFRSEDEYRLLGKLLRKAAQDDQLATSPILSNQRT
jgi:hypothetical protein